MADYSKTTRLFLGEDLLKAPPGDKFLRAVQRAVAGDFDVLGELGRGGRGKIVYLARESKSRRLVALQLLPGESGVQAGELWLDVLRQLDGSVPSAEGNCPKCGQNLRGWGRYCSQCGSDLSGVAPGAGDASADSLLEAVKQVAGSKYEVLGQMDRSEGGGVVYFAKERDTGKIVALRLQKDAPAADGRERYNLGQTMILSSVVDSLLGPETPAPAPTPPVVSLGTPRPPLPPAPTPTPTKPLPPALVYGLALTALLVLVALVAWPLRHRGVATTPGKDSVATAVARPDSGEIQVGGALPAQAAITVDGSPLAGSTIKRPAGRYHLRATAPGFSAAEQDVELRPGQTLVWTPAFSRAVTPKPKPAAGPRPPTPAPKPQAAPVDTGATLAIRQAPTPPPLPDTAPAGPLSTGGATCASLFSALEWSRALPACEREASGGGTAAQRTLGTMYERGLATEASMSTAAGWYAKAGEAGDRIAQYRLGVLLRNGRDIKKDEKASVKWFQRSAEQGEADAQLAMGQAYDRGQGVKRSRTTAAAWYLKAAEQGKAEAQFRLGEFSEKGEGGLPKSDTEALKWYKLAAAQGHAQALEKISKH